MFRSFPRKRESRAKYGGPSMSPWVPAFAGTSGIDVDSILMGHAPIEAHRLFRFEMASHPLAIQAEPAELLNAPYHGFKTAFPAQISGAAGQSLQRLDADPEVVAVERRNGFQRAFDVFKRHITISRFDVKTLDVIYLTECELGIPADADEHAFSTLTIM